MSRISRPCIYVYRSVMSSGELCPHDHAGACVLYNYTAIIFVARPGNISACTQTLHCAFHKGSLKDTDFSCGN